MEIEELDTALDELEVRLERLRALYEQYFLGLEKIEPTIARKDVDRRIYVLRREKIRNTGKRFKLQTLIQRYNTFQQYWQRICREIENGTYRRHIQRAERTMGPSELLTVAARRRFGKERAVAPEEPAAEAEAVTESAAAAGATSRAPRRSSAPARERPSRVPQSAPLETPTIARGARVPSMPPLAAPPVPKNLSARGAPPPRPPMETPPLPFPNPHLESGYPPRPVEPVASRESPPRDTTPREPARQPMPASMRPPKSAAPKPYESLELDMDFMGDWDPATSGGGRSALGAAAPPKSVKLAPPPKPGRPGAAPPKPARPEAPRVEPSPVQPPSVAAPPLEAPRVDVESPRKRPHRVTHPGLAPPPPGTPGPMPAVIPPPATAAPKPPVGAAPPPPVAAAPGPISRPTPPLGSVAPPPPEPAVPAVRPAASQERAAGQEPAGAAAREARAAARKAATAAAAAGPPPAVTLSSLTEERLRVLHTRLLEETRKTNLPSVSLEGMSRSLRNAEAKLRQQHGNRRIDFEVVMKDGKPVLKPVVR